MKNKFLLGMVQLQPLLCLVVQLLPILQVQILRL